MPPDSCALEVHSKCQDAVLQATHADDGANPAEGTADAADMDGRDAQDFAAAMRDRAAAAKRKAGGDTQPVCHP